MCFVDKRSALSSAVALCRVRATENAPSGATPDLYPMKTKGLNEAQFLALLQKVLSAKTADAHLVSEIYEGVAHEVRIHNGLASLEKFCEKEGVPDAAPETIATLQQELE